MYLAIGIVFAILFWLAVKISSYYLYGEDVASTVAHLPIYVPGGYSYIVKAVAKAENSRCR